jgi:hypothetical protein
MQTVGVCRQVKNVQKRPKRIFVVEENSEIGGSGTVLVRYGVSGASRRQPVTVWRRLWLQLQHPLVIDREYHPLAHKLLHKLPCICAIVLLRQLPARPMVSAESYPNGSD